MVEFEESLEDFTAGGFADRIAEALFGFVNAHSRGTSLRRRKERFLIRREGVTHEFAATKVTSIVVATGVHFTSDVVQLAHQHNVDIVFLDRSGMPTARVWQTKMGSTATIRRRQLEVCETNEGLQFATEWVGGKLDNQIGFLQELLKRRPESKLEIDSVVTSLGQLREKIASVDGDVSERRGTVMGLEGTAGRIYFDCLAKMMPAESNCEPPSNTKPTHSPTAYWAETTCRASSNPKPYSRKDSRLSLRESIANSAMLTFATLTVADRSMPSTLSVHQPPRVSVRFSENRWHWPIGTRS